MGGEKKEGKREKKRKKKKKKKKETLHHGLSSFGSIEAIVAPSLGRAARSEIASRGNLRDRNEPRGRWDGGERKKGEKKKKKKEKKRRGIS